MPVKMSSSSSETEAVKRVKMSEDSSRRERETEARVYIDNTTTNVNFTSMRTIQATQPHNLLSGMDQRWRNWWIRGTLSVVMISLFVVVVYMGPIALSLLVSYSVCRLNS